MRFEFDKRIGHQYKREKRIVICSQMDWADTVVYL